MKQSGEAPKESPADQTGRSEGRTLQETILPKDPIIMGIISHLAGSTLQEDIAAVCRFLVAKGNEVLGKRKGM